MFVPTGSWLGRVSGVCCVGLVGARGDRGGVLPALGVAGGGVGGAGLRNLVISDWVRGLGRAGRVVMVRSLMVLGMRRSARSSGLAHVCRNGLRPVDPRLRYRHILLRAIMCRVLIRWDPILRRSSVLLMRWHLVLRSIRSRSSIPSSVRGRASRSGMACFGLIVGGGRGLQSRLRRVVVFSVRGRPLAVCVSPWACRRVSCLRPE